MEEMGPILVSSWNRCSPKTLSPKCLVVLLLTFQSCIFQSCLASSVDFSLPSFLLSCSYISLHLWKVVFFCSVPWWESVFLPTPSQGSPYGFGFPLKLWKVHSEDEVVYFKMHTPHIFHCLLKPPMPSLLKVNSFHFQCLLGRSIGRW